MDNNEIEFIKAYINKPESEEFYIDAFNAYTKAGVEQFKWKWSWWALAGGVFFLLYRKLYVEAIVFFLISSIASAVPVAYLIIWIISGALFPYLVFKRYQKGKEMVMQKFNSKEEQIEALREFGGYNQWAIYLGVAINVLVLMSIILVAYKVMLISAV